ncbi:PAS domain-containing protein [Kordiimonas pumila]|uniref:PAS domain-containing protein n=1 Tax=Kordiimonas pumila TaxID=2161677 RepID=A0ABV7D3C3_9PROT|nr:hypothetical protein [Kordiimonas pumila]
MQGLNPIFTVLEAYWWQLQERREKDAERLGVKPALVPLRKSFEPFKIPEVLPHITLLELDENNVMHSRLVGSGLENVVPVLPKRLSLAISPVDVWHGFVKPHKTLFETPCGLRFENHTVLSNRQSFIMNRFSLPFADLDGRIKYVISASMPDEKFITRPSMTTEVVHLTVKTLFYVDLGYGVPATDSASTGSVA